MKKIIVMQGLPGSGKTTEAIKIRKDLIAEGWDVYRINRDSLRKMLHFDEWTPRNEAVTVDVQVAAARVILEKANSGKNRALIIDDTNLTSRHIERWMTLSREFKCEFEVSIMTTPLDECISRDARRPDGERVGRLKIMEMALSTGQIPSGTKIVVTDLDGTIANIEHRLHFVRDVEKKDWNGFFRNIIGDAPRPEVWKQFQDAYEEVRATSGDEPVYRIIFSARPERTREHTEMWLERHGFLNEVDALIMRPDGDSRQDDEMKRIMFDRFLKNYTVVKIFDDRPRVIRVWKELGLDVVDVGPGVEF